LKQRKKPRAGDSFIDAISGYHQYPRYFFRNDSISMRGVAIVRNL
jgi:hypothetical protein